MCVDIDEGWNWVQGQGHWVKGQGQINDFLKKLVLVITHVLLLGLKPKLMEG